MFVTMNVFHCSEKLGKSTTGVNDRYRHAVIYMPSAPTGTRFKYRRTHTLVGWDNGVDINTINPYERFHQDDKKTTTFMLFSRSRECAVV